MKRAQRWIPLAFLAGAALSPVLGHAGPESDPKLKFEKYTLPNGVEVILHQDNSVPLVAVDVWYHVGSGDETPGKSGFAHLFEHMMFQGTENTGQDAHFDILQNIGASDVNGTTNTDRTNYFEVVPSNQLETALWLESDRMGYLLPLVNEKSLANQRDVVRNERRQRYDNAPYSQARFKLAEALYPEGHPYRYLTIGRHEDLEGASLEDVRGFYKKWYVPSNSTICIAGDFESAEAKKLVEKWFGGFPKSTKPARKTAEPNKITSKQRIELTDKLAPLTRLQYAWNSPGFFKAGDAELDLLSSILGSETGRLYKILVIEKQLAQNIGVSQQSQQQSSIFSIVVDLAPGADQAEVEKILSEQLADLAKNPVSQKEFDRAVTGYEAGYIRGLEDLMQRAEMLEMYNHYVGNPDYISSDLDRYRKSSPAQIRDIVAKYLGEQSRVEIIVKPAAKEGK